MLSVYECVVEQHDLLLVAVALAICLLASYTAYGLCLRAHAGRAAWLRACWIAAAAIVIGSGVACTHFVAMLAYKTPVPVTFDVGMTVMSIAVAAVISGVGLALLLLGLPALGGGVVGLAIATMHFVGMAALRLPARMHWEWDFVAASVAISTAGGAVALTLGQQRRWPSLHMLAPLALVLTIVALHFTAMTAVRLEPDPFQFDATLVGSPNLIVTVVVSVTMLILGFGLVGTLVDVHLAQREEREADRLRAYVSELERTKAALEQRSAEAAAALRTADASNLAKSQFLANMSHELRTPLNAIIGYSSMQVAEMLGPMGNPTYKQYAKDILGAGEHLLALINDILDISRLDAGVADLREEEVDVAVLVDEVVRMIAPQCEAAGLRAEVAVPEGLPAVTGDHRRLRQVLLNLASNAVKFTPAPGEIRISASLAEDGLELAVRDTGIGIPANRIDLAFERFGQVDNSLSRKYEGTGLGLPLARQLVELHGGTLGLDSVEGQGTTVTVRLPAGRLVGAARAA